MTSPTPLAGLRVLEFTHMVMGPTAGMVLADLGAEVIKVEPAPEGDTTRRLGGSGTGFYPAFGRGRRSLAVDMTAPEGLALVQRLAANGNAPFPSTPAEFASLMRAQRTTWRALVAATGLQPE